MHADPHLADVGGSSRPEVLHWYDFVCPFCYLAQPDNDELAARGVDVVDLGFRAHPEIPEGGLFVGPRSGAMYEQIDRLAAARGLPLNWPDRLPSTRLALGAAEWIRSNASPESNAFRSSMFAAHFADGEDIGMLAVVLRHADAAGVVTDRLEQGISDGTADRLLRQSETLGRSAGVAGTPAWLGGGRIVSGLQPGPLYERLADGRV